MIRQANGESDPVRKAELLAEAWRCLDDIGTGATTASLISPLSIAGRIAGYLGSITSLSTGVIEGELDAALAKEALQKAAVTYMTKVYTLSEAVANRVTALIDLSGGWQAFIDRVKNSKGDKDNSKP